MSGLAGILAAHHPAGVHLWHAAFTPEEVRHTVEHAGWAFGHVDGWLHQDKAGLLADIGATLEFPDWYGANFDALTDCLRDVIIPTVLLWDGWGTLAREDRRAFDIAIDVFRGRAEDTPAFAVLLRGEGPDVGIESIDS